jgi:hypothetical protein
MTSAAQGTVVRWAPIQLGPSHDPWVDDPAPRSATRRGAAASRRRRQRRQSPLLAESGGSSLDVRYALPRSPPVRFRPHRAARSGSSRGTTATATTTTCPIHRRGTFLLFVVRAPTRQPSVEGRVGHLLGFSAPGAGRPIVCGTFVGGGAQRTVPAALAMQCSADTGGSGSAPVPLFEGSVPYESLFTTTDPPNGSTRTRFAEGA